MELTFNIFLKCFQVLKAKPTLKKKKTKKNMQGHKESRETRLYIEAIKHQYSNIQKITECYI